MTHDHHQAASRRRARRMGQEAQDPASLPRPRREEGCGPDRARASGKAALKYFVLGRGLHSVNSVYLYDGPASFEFVVRDISNCAADTQVVLLDREYTTADEMLDATDWQAKTIQQCKDKWPTLKFGFFAQPDPSFPAPTEALMLPQDFCSTHIYAVGTEPELDWIASRVKFAKANAHNKPVYMTVNIYPLEFFEPDSQFDKTPISLKAWESTLGQARSSGANGFLVFNPFLTDFAYASQREKWVAEFAAYEDVLRGVCG